VERWIRYRIALSPGLMALSPGMPDSTVRLQPVTSEIIDSLRRHPDHDANQLKSGFKFWALGLGQGYVWMDDAGPLCIQWLLSSADNPRLDELREWAGLYEPLPDGSGRVENLYAFSTARGKGIATRFEFALYAEAGRLGLKRLLTHIHEANDAAHAWAGRTGWRRYGTVTRYSFDVPGLRDRPVFRHEADPEHTAGSSPVQPVRVA
jgi:GNAT superfamily N-acetyltransferase